MRIRWFGQSTFLISGEQTVVISHSIVSANPDFNRLPIGNVEVRVIDNDKAVAWLRKGAQPTDRVQRILQVSGAWDEFKAGAS